MRLTRRESSRVEMEKIRLPLVAMIDVILFLLFYFIVAGNLAAEEATLSTTLGSAEGRSNSTLQSQVLEIVSVNGVAANGATVGLVMPIVFRASPATGQAVSWAWKHAWGPDPSVVVHVMVTV